MNKVPEFLYRNVNSIEALEAHISGKLWLRPCKHFRESKDNSRQDSMEGIGSYRVDNCYDFVDVSDSRPIQEYYILSTSKCRNSKFGNFCIEISNLAELKSRIIKALPDGWGCMLRWVDYDKTDCLSNELCIEEKKVVF